jgi:DNA-directed RNA polymerase specialized sigma24 family protein
VNALTARQRQILELKASGLKNVEIARQLGLAQGTVCHTIQRAQARLTKRLCEVCGEDPAGDSGLCGFCEAERRDAMGA